jgi:ribosome-associated protein
VTEPLEVRPGLVIPAADMRWEFSRSGGPGGQHVNTTDTRARLWFAVARCAVLGPGVKTRLLAAHPAWCTSEGELVITSDEHRSRSQNVEACRTRLADAIRAALVPPRIRRPTAPTKASAKRRFATKKARGTVKSTRRKVDPSDSG